MLMLAVACVDDIEEPQRQRPEPVEVVDTGAECDSDLECCPMANPDTGLACVPELCCHTSRGCYWTGYDGASYECGEAGERPCWEAQDLAVASCSL